ncbi:hypothetical protein BJY59DRAFT_712937 [Rhodotorula toruloides]
MPRRAPNWTGFQQTVGDVLAAYGAHGQGLSQFAPGRQFKVGVLEATKDGWASLDRAHRERVIERMEKDATRVQALFKRLSRESSEYPRPAACFRSLLGDAEYNRHGSSRSYKDLGEAYGLMLLRGEGPATNDEATVVAPPQVAMSSSASASSPRRPSASSSRPPSHAQPPEYLPPTHPLPLTAPEALEEAHIPTLDLKTTPSDLLYTFGANRFLQTVYAYNFLEGLKTVLPGDKWAQLMEAPGCGDCQAPFERVQQDSEKLEQAWETTPHIKGRPAFKAMSEVLLGQLVTVGVFKEAVEQNNAEIIGEAYAVMLASLAVDKVIRLPSLRDLAFRRGQILSFAFESLGAVHPHRSSPFLPVPRAARW